MVLAEAGALVDEAVEDHGAQDLEARAEIDLEPRVGLLVIGAGAGVAHGVARAAALDHGLLLAVDARGGGAGRHGVHGLRHLERRGHLGLDELGDVVAPRLGRELLAGEHLHLRDAELAVLARERDAHVAAVDAVDAVAPGDERAGGGRRGVGSANGLEDEVRVVGDFDDVLAELVDAGQAVEHDSGLDVEAAAEVELEPRARLDLGGAHGA